MLVGWGARTGLLRGLGDAHQVQSLKTDDAGDGGKDAQAKQPHEDILLSAGDLQPPEQRHGDGDEDDVGGDVDGGVGKGEARLVHARSLGPHHKHPVRLDRPAGKDGREESPEAVDDEQDKVSTEEALHPVGTQHTVALHRDRELAEDEAQIINRNGRPYSLCMSVDVVIVLRIASKVRTCKNPGTSGNVISLPSPDLISSRLLAVLRTRREGEALRSMKMDRNPIEAACIPCLLAPVPLVVKGSDQHQHGCE